MAKQRSDAQDAAARNARPKRAKTQGPQEAQTPMTAAPPSNVGMPENQVALADDRSRPFSDAVTDTPSINDRRSTSMGSEPSEEDIRLRAYHRYLERGGGHGMDFEDWLEAERELKQSR
jgi:Protein of unknown function (DUF2934)